MLPMAARTNPHAHGISSDDDEDDERGHGRHGVGDHDVRMLDSSQAGEGEGEDVNMLDPWDDEYIFLGDDGLQTTSDARRQ
jgi:hypothetical protein